MTLRLAIAILLLTPLTVLLVTAFTPDAFSHGFIYFGGIGALILVPVSFVGGIIFVIGRAIYDRNYDRKVKIRDAETRQAQAGMWGDPRTSTRFVNGQRVRSSR